MTTAARAQGPDLDGNRHSEQPTRLAGPFRVGVEEWGGVHNQTCRVVLILAETPDVPAARVGWAGSIRWFRAATRATSQSLVHRSMGTDNADRFPPILHS